MSLDLNTMDKAALDALVALAKSQLANLADGNKAEYAESITDFVTKVVANETFGPNKADSKKAWVGKSIYGISVVVDGHAFTVSATVTDTQKSAELQGERDLAAAKALILAKEEPVPADA